MSFLKKWFGKFINMIAYPIAKAQDKIAEYCAPLIAMSQGHNVKWTWKWAGKVLLGAALLACTAGAIALAVIMSIATITWLLALVLPALLANLIAVLVTGYIAYRVYKTEEQFRAAEITVELEVETE